MNKENNLCVLFIIAGGAEAYLSLSEKCKVGANLKNYVFGGFSENFLTKMGSVLLKDLQTTTDTPPFKICRRKVFPKRCGVFRNVSEIILQF